MVINLEKNFIEVRPICFPDKCLVVVGFDKIVEVHNYHSEVIWKFEENHKILKLEICNNINAEFYFALESGEIKICNIKNRSQTKVFQAPTQLSDFFLSNNDLITIENKTINLYENFDVDKKKQITDKAFQCVSYSQSTGIIGMVENITLMVICHLNNRRSQHGIHKWHKEYCLTAVACHPNQPVVATADTGGHVMIWYDVLKSLKQHKVLHWHFLSLRTIEFNHNGSYLYSGGREQVLIKWNISVTASENQKSVLPRMEADIESIRACKGDENECVLVTLADNSYRVFSTSLQTLHSFFSLIQRSLFLHKKVSKFCKLSPIGVNYWRRDHRFIDHNNWSNVILNGQEGKLQFYNLSERHVDYQLDVACQNWPTETENNLIPGFFQVELFALSKCGKYLAAILSPGWNPNDSNRRCRRSLRIFKYDHSNKKFVLESTMSLKFGEISDLIFYPQDDYLVLVTNSLNLAVMKREVDIDIAKWEIINLIELEELLYKKQILININNNEASAKLSTEAFDDESNRGFLLLTKNDFLIMFRWDELIAMKNKVTMEVNVNKLLEDIDFPDDIPALKTTILSSVIFKNPELTGLYRIVLALDFGLIRVDINLNEDEMIELRNVTSALSKSPVKRMVPKPMNKGSKSTLAVLFENSDHLTVFDVWGDSDKLITAPILEDVTWVPTNMQMDDWTLVGLVTKDNRRSVIALEDTGVNCFNMTIKEQKLIESNLLSQIGDVKRMTKIEKKPHLKRKLDTSFSQFSAKLCIDPIMDLTMMFMKQ